MVARCPRARSWWRTPSARSRCWSSTWPRGRAAPPAPRVLSLVELEQLRDELLQRLEHNRRMLSDRTYGEELNRRRIEEMLLAPDEHKWVVIRNEDIGERGCKSWHVRPRFGLLGMLM